MYISFHRTTEEYTILSAVVNGLEVGGENNVFPSVRIPSHKQHRKKAVLHIALQK